MNKANYDIHYLRKYVKGELSSKEMYAIERASQEDEMLMDIILGLEMEAQQELAPAKDDLLIAIRERSTQKTHVHTIFNKRNLSIAASIVFLIGIGSLFYFYNPTNTTEDVIATVIEPTPPTKSASKLTDSSENQVEETTLDTTQNNLIAQIPEKKEPSELKIERNTANKITTSETEFEEEKLVLDSKIKPLDNVAEEVIIAQVRPTVVGSAPQPQRVVLPSQKVTVKSNNQNQVQSSAQLHAKVNAMNLDPQSKAALREIIDRNERELVNSKKINLTNNDQGIIDSSASNVLASSGKTNQSKGISSFNKSDQSIILSPSSMATWSQPLIPKSDYLDNMRAELAKLTDKDYLIKLTFRLDSNGTPKHIKILESSDSKLNKKVKKLIENGAKWHIGTDKDSVNLEIKK